MTAPLRVLYLVHDLSDPAVLRRIAMLRQGGAQVMAVGFRRTPTAPDEVAGAPAVDLGQTFNANFVQRIVSVLKQVCSVAKHRGIFENADVIIARNLEMLAIGVRGRAIRRTPAPLVYESLDIHRLLLRDDKIGALLRRLEGWLSRRAALLITSSPAFIREYFEKRSRVRLPVLLIENKVYTDTPPAPAAHRQPGPPWFIGWFGAIRCRKSLNILRELVSRAEGSVKVVIRGRPSYDQFDDFDRLTRDTPGLSFAGPYKNPDDLPSMYRQVHFTWAIDMFEEGLNSSWLLPNRLYEGGLHGSVPLAQSGVETGRRMAQLGIGVGLPSISAEELLAYFNRLTPTQYQALENKVMELPATTWTHGQQACLQLVARLRELAPAPRRTAAPLPVEAL